MEEKVLKAPNRKTRAFIQRHQTERLELLLKGTYRLIKKSDYIETKPTNL